MIFLSFGMLSHDDLSRYALRIDKSSNGLGYRDDATKNVLLVMTSRVWEILLGNQGKKSFYLLESPLLDHYLQITSPSAG
jgi:hypothetical protein